jgi:hypothetical protein
MPGSPAPMYRQHKPHPCLQAPGNGSHNHIGPVGL